MLEQGSPSSIVPRPPAVAVNAETLVLALAAVLVALVVLASALAPRLSTEMDAARIGADGGNAYTFSPGLQVHWPYVVPSHPDAVLSRRDVALFEEDGPLGPPEPSHDEIRRLGGGRFDFWQGDLWFSTSDNTDPRENGRNYVLLVKTRVNGLVKAVGLVCGLLLAAAALGKIFRRVKFDAGRRFGEVFIAVSGGLLGAFVVLTVLRDMPVLYMADSFSYMYPGLLLAAGKASAGISARDLGYPSVAAAAVELGSLALIPRLQLAMVAAGLVAMLAVLLVYLRSILARSEANGLSYGPLFALALAALGPAYCVLLFSHDGFVINIYRIMAEAPHVLPTALAFMFFVLGWTTSSPRKRILYLAAATCAAYLSTVFKPHTLLVFALCAASLVLACVIHRKLLRSRAVLLACTLAVCLIGLVHHLDAWITPPGDDFGPKTLFCNHLDAVVPVIGSATPERAALSHLLENVIAQGPHGWPTMGYDGDLCFYNQQIADGIAAMAKASGVPTATWLDREFVKGVLSRPLRYARDVGRELGLFFRRPIVEISGQEKGSMPDGDWARLQPFADLIRMPRDRFDTRLTNWVPAKFPRVAEIAKRSLRLISDWFAPVVGLSTVLALAGACWNRSRQNLAPELAILAAAAFTLAFAMTTALSHTFDISRYSVSILPFSLVWWAMGSVYLVVTAATLLARMLRPLTGAMVKPGTVSIKA